MIPAQALHCTSELRILGELHRSSEGPLDIDDTNLGIGELLEETRAHVQAGVVAARTFVGDRCIDTLACMANPDTLEAMLAALVDIFGQCNDLVCLCVPCTTSALVGAEESAFAVELSSIIIDRCNIGMVVVRLGFVMSLLVSMLSAAVMSGMVLLGLPVVLSGARLERSIIFVLFIFFVIFIVFCIVVGGRFVVCLRLLLLSWLRWHNWGGRDYCSAVVSSKEIGGGGCNRVDVCAGRCHD